MNRWMKEWMNVYIYIYTYEWGIEQALRLYTIGWYEMYKRERKKFLPFVVCCGCHAEVFEVVVCAMGICDQSSRGRKLFDAGFIIDVFGWWFCWI